MPLVITIPGAPVPKARPKFARMGNFVRAYTPAGTEKYERRVKALAQAEMMTTGMAMMLGPVRLEVVLTLPIRASWSKRKKLAAETGALLPAIKPDLDNLLKALQDALNHIVFHDDSQIVDLHVTKQYGVTPGAKITVTALGDAVEQEQAA